MNAMNALLAVFEWFTDLVVTLWKLLVVAFWLVPAGYLLYSGVNDPQFGVRNGVILAGVWLGFAFVVFTLFNAVCKIERWANRGRSPD